MSALAKKHPIKSVQIYMDGAVYQFRNVPPSSIKPVLLSLQKYQDEGIPWRKVMGHRLQKHGGEAALVLRGSRFKEGLTQVELAKQLKIPQQHISEMECGKRPIGKKMARKLADVFHADYRLFL